ncbi:hypothetical protein [Priestia flexa]|uniref:hypothetical protein n=1 Tax=Priestia flexa TaxID=86664 RepID=UPI001B31B10F|nr:hypothetical protein [Priestia flexa]
MSIWYFIIGALIAVIGMMFIYQSTIYTIEGKLQEDKTDNEIYQDLVRIQTMFFIKHAVVEIVPLILIVLAFMNPEPASSMSPLIILAVVWIGALLRIYQTHQRVASNLKKEQFRGFLTKFMMIEIGLISAFPIIAAVGSLTLNVG